MTVARIVNGMKFNRKGFKKARLVIRFTHDNLGESLSISDDKGIMLQVPFEGMEELIHMARTERSD
jgi:hypothetical protein